MRFPSSLIGIEASLDIRLGDSLHSQMGKLRLNTQEWKDSEVLGVGRARAGVQMLCLLRLASVLFYCVPSPPKARGTSEKTQTCLGESLIWNSKW